MQAHAEIVKALAAYLDGHPAVAWIEPGSYGYWGEGHLDGVAPGCAAHLDTRAALIAPWIESFRHTSLSITMNWLCEKDDPAHRLRDLWGKAARIGLRFDCLGFWHDEYAEVLEKMAASNPSGWNGEWGGEFCHSEAGARWAMGSGEVTNVKKLRREAPPPVSKMTAAQRQERTLRLVRECRWSYIAGAGRSLIEKAVDQGSAGLSLEAAMSADSAGRDLKKCAAAAQFVNP